MMEHEYVIEVEHVTKKFKVYADKGTMLKERVLFANRNQYEIREILKDISFRIPRGQTVGLIGKNGCGKSTILKMLSRILKPNAGNILVRGRVSSLIELGAGFHPDMSGRENIYINATIFGLKKEEIDQRLSDIIRFSELEEFIDNPVRTYSSGMYMRLAFAVAINVNADILLIDEILAVGDAGFQKKCFQRLQEIKKQGTTIVIVSHAIEQMCGICDRLIWIENGKVQEDGQPKPVAMHYLDFMEEERLKKLNAESHKQFQDASRHSILELATKVHPDARRDGTQEVYFTGISLFNQANQKCQCFDTGDKVILKMTYKTNLISPQANFNMDFVKENWQYCYGCCYAKPGDELLVLKESGEVSLVIDALMLLPGKYYLDVGINGPAGELYDSVRNIMQITVRDYVHDEFGPCTFVHHWQG